MSNVVNAFGNPLSHEPIPEVVRVLKDFLKRAEDGNLRAIGFAGIGPSGEVYIGYERAENTAYSLCGAMQLLLHSYSVRLNEG